MAQISYACAAPLPPGYIFLQFSRLDHGRGPSNDVGLLRGPRRMATGTIPGMVVALMAKRLDVLGVGHRMPRCLGGNYGGGGEGRRHEEVTRTTATQRVSN